MDTLCFNGNELLLAHDYVKLIYVHSSYKSFVLPFAVVR